MLTPPGMVLLALAVAFSLMHEFRGRPVPWWAWAAPLLAVCVVAVVDQGLGDLDGGLLSALGGGALCGLVWAVARRIGRLEWPDVGLMAVVGAAFGLQGTPAALLFISVVGALLAVCIALVTRWRTGSFSNPRRVPYAVAVALGSAWAQWWLMGAAEAAAAIEPSYSLPG